MSLACPRCRRKLADSVDPAEAPSFCMYCGQKLRGDETRTAAPVAMPDPGATRDYTGDTTPEADAAPRAAELEAVGEYRLVRFLGAGGMGTVYEAESETSGHRVAVKVLSGRLASNPASVERFRQEGRVASQITHPNCVFVLGADAAAGRPYIVMELMPGRTLKDLVDQRGPLPTAEATTRILDVIAGLAEAHRVGVIHRDVKPSNCFLTDDDRVKVGDFGLSKSLSGGANGGQITQSGAFLGTVLFASPEQIRGEPVHYDSDVYSVCGTLYYLLAGRAPYQHESLTAALAKAVSEPPPPLRAKRPDVPSELERVIFRGLERDRDRRWQSLDELGEALRELLPTNQRPARRRALVSAYLVDLAILILVGVVLGVLLELMPGARERWIEVVWQNEAILLLYFALFEGLLGWTLGKRLLRLHVARVGETGPPGLVAAVIRTLTFPGFWLIVFLFSEAPVHGGWVPAVRLLGALTAGGLLLLQIRPTAGWYRGVHDLASGCRVYQRPRPAYRVRLVSRYPNPLDRTQPSADPLPGALGGFAVKGKACDLPDGGEAWAAEDRALARRVLLRVLPPGRAENEGEDVTRPTRLRIIGRGTFVWKGSQRGWVASVAPAGAPLLDVVDPAHPLNWADTRPLLEQLVGELMAGAADGSGVARPTLEQVWVEPGGRLQLLDFPLPCSQAEGEKRRRGDKETETTPALPVSPSPPLAFVRRVASLALEGRPRAAGGRIAAPLPLHASRITDRLFDETAGYETLAQLRGDLTDDLAQSPQVSAGMRAGHLGVQAALLAFGLVVMFFLSGLLNFSLATAHVAQTRGAEDVRDAIADPAHRQRLLERVRTMPVRRAEVREWMERDLSPDRVPRTLARLGALVAQRKTEEVTLRAHLTKPERVLLDRFDQAMADEPMDNVLSLPVVENALRASRRDELPTPAEVRWGTFVMFALGVVIWPIGWAVFALAFRGGLGLSLAGIALVRADGRRADRWRCAARELLVWLPLTLVLLLSLWLQAAAPERVGLRTALWLVGGLMLPVYVMVALRDPARPPQDRIMGTYLVPV